MKRLFAALLAGLLFGCVGYQVKQSTWPDYPWDGTHDLASLAAMLFVLGFPSR